MIVMLCPDGVKSDKKIEECINYWKNLKEKNDSAFIEGDGFKFKLTLVSNTKINDRITKRRFKL